MTNLLSMLTVWYLQFYQPMVLSSLVVSFIPVAIASLQSHGDRNNSNTNPGIVRNLFLSICRTIAVLALAVVVNVLLKVSVFPTNRRLFGNSFYLCNFLYL
jgi:hypothetical protein